MPLSGLMSAIIDWERELEYVEKVYSSMGKTFSMDDEDRRLHVINMVPKDFGDYLLRESARFSTYSDVRSEIVEHIARSKRHAHPGVRSLAQDLVYGEVSEEPALLEGLEELDDQEKNYILSLADFGEDHQASILALVKNTKAKFPGKGGKGGKSKGKKGDGGGAMDVDRREGKGPATGCFKCGEAHYFRDCLKATEEEKSKGKGKK